MVDDMLKHPCEHPEEARADARYSEGDSDCAICQGLLRHWCKHPEEAYADARYKKGDTLCPACDGLDLPLLDRAQRAAPRPAWERAAEGCAWAGVGPHAAARPHRRVAAARAYCFCKGGLELRRTEGQRAAQRQAPHLETDMARQYEVRPPPRRRGRRPLCAARPRGGPVSAGRRGRGAGQVGRRLEREARREDRAWSAREDAWAQAAAWVRASALQVPPVLAYTRRGTAARAPGRGLAAWVPGRGRL